MKNQDTTSYIVRRLLSEHIFEYRGRIIFAIFCMVIMAWCAALNAWMMQPALDNIFINRNQQMLVLIPLVVIAIAIVGAAAHYGNNIAMRFVGQRIIADMQKRLFTHLMRSDIGIFQEESSGRMISRFTNDINLLRNAFSNVLTTLAKESLSMVFLLGVMVYQNFTLSVIALAAFPTAIYPIIRIGKRMRKISDKTQSEMGNFTSSLNEVFHGVRTVKAYNREEFEVSRLGGIIESLFGLYYKSARVQSASTPLMEILSGISIGSVIWFGGSQVLDGSISAGAFFSFITAFLMAYKPVRAMSGLNGVFQEGIAAATRLFQVLDTPPKIVDKEGAKSLAVTEGKINFENVSFNYGEDGKKSGGVSEINLEIPAGKTAALVGLSGGGKSTIVNLLLRFYDVDNGRICIDGQDTKETTIHSLREAIGFVPQEPMLFDDTIRANIEYGRSGASLEEVVAAAKSAAADEFIRALPQGYDTMVGAHGVRLSGGQRQRIAIARAILRNAPILLLDEATIALDNESERSIQNAISGLMQGRTSLIVAHRLSTIIHADIIFVVEGGKVLEQGNHKGLLNKKGRYFQLYSHGFEGV